MKHLAVGKRRIDLDNRYFRSKAEANFARYLNYLKENNFIYNWQYEVDEFEFPVKRGNRFYKPDFKVFEKEDSIPYYVEIKGRMDRQSKTKLNRMQKYFPHIEIRLIMCDEVKRIGKQLGAVIGNWE